MADISITAASTLAGSNAQIVRSGTAGATITAGQCLYIDTSDSNKLKLTDIDASAPANTCAGIALHGASSGQPIAYVTEDDDFTVGGAVLTAGTIYVCSDTAGGIMPAADLESGDTAIVLGIGKSTTKLNLLKRHVGAAV